LSCSIEFPLRPSEPCFRISSQTLLNERCGGIYHVSVSLMSTESFKNVDGPSEFAVSLGYERLNTFSFKFCPLLSILLCPDNLHLRRSVLYNGRDYPILFLFPPIFFRMFLFLKFPLFFFFFFFFFFVYMDPSFLHTPSPPALCTHPREVG